MTVQSLLDHLLFHTFWCVGEGGGLGLLQIYSMSQIVKTTLPHTSPR